MDSETFKKVAKEEHKQSVENYQLFHEEVRLIDRKMFDFKVAFAGFLGICITVIFSNIDYFSLWLLIAILMVTFFVFITLIYEMLREGRQGVKNRADVERDALLASIRQIGSLNQDLKNYIKEAENRYRSGNLMLQAMKEGKSVDEILKDFTKPPKWEMLFAWWGLLFLSIPVLFIVQLVYLYWSGSY